MFGRLSSLQFRIMCCLSMLPPGTWTPKRELRRLCKPSRRDSLTRSLKNLSGKGLIEFRPSLVRITDLGRTALLVRPVDVGEIIAEKDLEDAMTLHPIEYYSTQ